MASAKNLRILSWNVGGIRSISKKGFAKSVESVKADVLCLQGTRTTPRSMDIATEMPTVASAYPTRIWNPSEKRGYCGTMVMLKDGIARANSEHGSEVENCVEGRVQRVDLGFANLVNLYAPGSGLRLSRLPYRLEWNKAFTKYMVELQKIKPLLICGDFNVAHRDIDLARPRGNHDAPRFSLDERLGMFNLLSETGMVDSFRHIHGNAPKNYTWWTNRSGARAANIGWRIDYFLVDPRLVSNLKDAWILPDIHGSDHCPIGITLSL